MKKINWFNLGFIFAGCFLGAGFLSGNELKQFFGNFGISGIFGCLISVAAICLFGAMILYISKNKSTEKIEDIILPFKSKILGSVIAVLQTVLVFAIIVIMTSGAATLIEETTGVNRVLAAAIFSVVLGVVALRGVTGVAAFFSVLVPVIAVFSLGIGIYLCTTNGIPQITSVAAGDTNPLLSHPLLASLSYLSYSIFSSVGIISPLAKHIGKNKTYLIGTAFGGLVLFVIATAIILSIYCLPYDKIGELPMLSAAMGINKIIGISYAVLLLGGMFGAALTSMMSISNYVTVKFTRIKLFWAVAILAALNFVGSLCGFGDLIGTVYPLFGYLGLIVLGLIAINFAREVKSKKHS
ncbi:MAG: hypothetical protein E7531_06620 [Ruminococcaceae bacterium]|nr:hypothetical protein [Oscillospiraceae bacterium]